MQICLIGGTGFVASALGNYALAEGIDVLVIGRTVPSTYKPTSFIHAELLIDEFPIQECVQSDIIFYCAAAGVQSSSKAEIDEVYHINTFFPIQLFNQLQQLKFNGNFVSFGSYFEIGFNNTILSFTEEQLVASQLKTPNDYCTSKRLLTRYFSSISTSGFYHFVLPTVFGEEEQQHRLLPYLIRSVSQGKNAQLTSGEQVRQYLHVKDMALLLFSFLKKSAPSGIYNVPSSQTIPVSEVAEIIYGYFKKQIPSAVFGKADKPDTGMKWLQLNANKFTNIQSLHTFKTIEQSIPDYLNYAY